MHENMYEHHLPSPERKSVKKHNQGEGESSDSSADSDEESHLLDYKKKVLEGSFLPSIAMLKLNNISVEDIVDPN